MGGRVGLLVLAFFGAVSAHALSFRDIQGWAERGEVKSVEDVLRRLPAEYRTHFVLMERSRSLQEASPEAPRALLFGERAELVLSFNGHPGQRGYDSLETVELDPSRMTYEIRAVHFVGGKAMVSGPNPEICLRCHRSLPRPNWEPYPHWPGALGQGPNYSADERRRLEAFSTAAAAHPRYRYLDFTRAKRRDTSPAFDLYALYTEQNLKRMARVLAAAPGYGSSIFAALADCPQVSPGPFAQDTLRRFQRLPAPYRPLLTGAIPSVMAKLRELLEPKGFAVDVLPNSFTERYFLTAAGSLVPQLLSRLPGLPAGAPLSALSAYFQPGTRPYGAAEKKVHADFCEAMARGMR